MRFRSLAASFVLAATVILIAGGANAGSGPPAPSDPQPAPGFSLPTLRGTVSSDSLRGHLYYLDFWASWCTPCKKSFPWLADLHHRYAAKGLRVIAVNLDKKRVLADQFLESNPAPFEIAFDPTGKTAEAFHVKAMPSSFLVGPDGTILYAVAGFDADKTGPLEALIKQWCTK